MTTLIELNGTSRSNAIRSFLKHLLSSDTMTSILIPLRTEAGPGAMPSLVTDPLELDRAAPLEPCFPLNTARVLSALTRKGNGERLGAWVRPCELRSVIELIKLRQIDPENLILISADCAGAMTNRHFRENEKRWDDTEIDEFINRRFSPDQKDSGLGDGIADACRVCTGFAPEAGDLHVYLAGKASHETAVLPVTEAGTKLVATMDPDETGNHHETELVRKDVIARLLKENQDRKQAMMSNFDDTLPDFASLSHVLKDCIGCHNCRVACPVCFCRECVFNTDVVDYEPFQYTSWAKDRGLLRMPTDTLFFHITRMVHMGLSCVGCGQCSNACPNEIPVAQLFIRAGEKAQAAFDYQAGRDVNAPPPLSVFHEKEFEDITGL